MKSAISQSEQFDKLADLIENGNYFLYREALEQLEDINYQILDYYF